MLGKANWYRPPKRRKTYRHLVLFSFLAVPTSDLSQWKVDRFQNSPQHEVSASKEGLRIEVKKSAGPLIFRLDKPHRAVGFRIKGEFLGLPNLSNPHLQGAKGQDDFPLRLGFVVPGKATLSGFQKIFAPSWLRHLIEELPPGMGLSHVQFYNVAQNLELVGKSRIHPKSDYLREVFFAHVRNSGFFEYRHSIDKPIEFIALWLSIDGDDTASDFKVLIRELGIEVL